MVRKKGSVSADKKMLEAAKRLSRKFHGNVDIVKLSAKERKPLPKYMVVAGDLTDMSYAPSKGSSRGKNIWVHKSGDRGFLKPKGKRKPLLAVNPITRKPVIIGSGSSMKFSGKQGFVG